MAMAMCGGTVIITFDEDHKHIMGVFMFHLILFWDITIIFTTFMDTVMDTHTVIILGGDHTTHGITTALMAEI